MLKPKNGLSAGHLLSVSKEMTAGKVICRGNFSPSNSVPAKTIAVRTYLTDLNPLPGILHHLDNLPDFLTELSLSPSVKMPISLSTKLYLVSSSIPEDISKDNCVRICMAPLRSSTLQVLHSRMCRKLLIVPLLFEILRHSFFPVFPGAVTSRYITRSDPSTTLCPNGP